MAATTSRIRLGTAIVNSWTRPQDGSSTGGGAGRGPDVVQFNNAAHQERTRPILTGLGWLLPSPYGAGSNAGAGRATRH